MFRKDHKDRNIFPLVAETDEIIRSLKAEFNWFSGVADSMYNKILPHLEDYHFSSRENHAAAMAFGARLAGARPAVLVQNSGLGLMIDALLGLQVLYKQGLVLFVTQRGELDWEEIQHKDWGSVTLGLLSSLNIDVIDFQKIGLSSISIAAQRAFSEEKIVVVLLHRGNVHE